MSTHRIALIAMLAAAAIGCGGGDGDNSGGNSPTAPSSTSSTPNAGCTRPAAPPNFTATVAGSSVTFTWSAVIGAVYYDIMVGTSPGSSNALSTNTTQTNYAWNGAPRGTYYARVEARNACGSGPASPEITFTVAPN